MPEEQQTETAEETVLIIPADEASEAAAAPETEEPDFGEYTHVKGVFYAKPPKLRQERALLVIQKQLISEDEQGAFEGLIAAALTLLTVRENGTLRAVSGSDIEDEFSSDELMALLSGVNSLALPRAA